MQLICLLPLLYVATQIRWAAVYITLLCNNEVVTSPADMAVVTFYMHALTRGIYFVEVPFTVSIMAMQFIWICSTTYRTEPEPGNSGSLAQCRAHQM